MINIRVIGDMMPDRIFFTGAPGSKWSGIAQDIEKLPGFNTSDRSKERQYAHKSYTGHLGNYFGPGMEYDSNIELKSNAREYVDSPWMTPGGTRVVKSHEWCFKIDYLRKTFPNDWIMMVYRPDLASYAWWHEAGGFKISYPSYDYYRDSSGILSAITAQNNAMLEEGYRYNAVWEPFTTEWVEKTFNVKLSYTVPDKSHDILVTVIK